MLSFKRFLYIVLIVAVLGGMFLIYNFMESQPASAQLQSCLVPEREWIAQGQVDKGETPRVWILGEPGEGRRGEIFNNVRTLCQDLRLTVAGEGRLDAGEATEGDLVIFCDASVSRWADPAELEELIAGGGRGRPGHSGGGPFGRGRGLPPAAGLRHPGDVPRGRLS